jgi:hypothetical protein
MATKFNWEDPFFLSQQLNDDERENLTRALRPLERLADAEDY